MTDIGTTQEQAARWHAREMTGGLSAQDALRLEDWLAQDVRHRLAYADVAAAAYALQQTPANTAVAQRRAARRWPVWLGAAIAPALLLVAMLWTPHAWQDWRSDAHTAIGALSAQQLPDGSTLQLDTDSAVALPFAPDRRDIELLRGALAIEVAKDPAHPLRVHCAGVEARAVGTRFVVAWHAGDEIEIGVTEGTVAVRANDRAEPILVQAGQRARVDTRSGTVRSDVLPALGYGWTRGVLSFDRVPLEQVVAEIARYMPEHVAFQAVQHAATPVTATFPIEHPDAALVAVARSNGLTLRHVPHVFYAVQD